MAPAPAPRNYWQLPTFALGLAAAAAAYAHFPPPPSDPRALLARDLASLREKLARDPLQPAELLAAVGRVAPQLRDKPDAAPADRFLAGSAYVKLAEVGPAAQSPEFWAGAKQFLDAVPDGALADAEDAKRLTYRRAKVSAAAGVGDPEALFKLLDKAPLREEEAAGGERARLIAETLLRKPRPSVDDLKRVRDELTVYLASARTPTPALAKLKLHLARTHAALNESDKARERLRDLPATAPAEVQAQAKLLLGRLAALDHGWGDSLKLYEAALALPLSPAEKSAAAFACGAALAQMKMPADAALYFEKAMADAGPAAPAARIRRAELLLQDPLAKGQRAKAVAWLEEAVRGLKSPGDFNNPFVPLPHAQAVFEEATQVALAEADYASALRAANAYGAISAPGRAQERRAEVNAAWALRLPGGPRSAEAAEKLRAAASDYTALAEGHPQPTGRADLWRRAADCLRKSGDLPGALDAVRRVTGSESVPPDARAAAWLDTGDMLAAVRNYPEAEEAYAQAARLGGPAAPMAQVKIALAEVAQARQKLAALTPDRHDEARRQLEKGQELLNQVANRAGDLPAERDAQQKALFELGKLLIIGGNFPDGEARLRQLLQLNPSGPLAGEARLYLGSGLVIVASGEGQAGGPPADAARKAQEARELLEQVASSGDPYLRMHADVRLVHVAILEGRLDALPGLCEQTAQRYKGRVEELIVWGFLHKAQVKAERASDAARTLDRMRAVYAALPDAAFDGGAEQYTRDYWEAEYFAPVRPGAGR